MYCPFLLVSKCTTLTIQKTLGILGTLKDDGVFWYEGIIILGDVHALPRYLGILEIVVDDVAVFAY